MSHSLFDDLEPSQAASPKQDPTVAPRQPLPDPFPELNQPVPATHPEPSTPAAVNDAPSASLWTALTQTHQAGRWSFFGALLLLILHAIFVAPALELGERQQRLASEKQRLSDLEPRLDAMREPLETLRQRAREGLRNDLEQLLTGVEDDLRRLDLAVDEIRAAAVVDEAVESTPPPANPSVQGSLDEAWEISDAELRFDIGRAEDAEALRQHLASLVEAEILNPRFGRLNSAWTTKVLPHLEARIDGLASDVPRMRGSLPEADEEWALFASSLSEVRRQAQDLNIPPPNDPNSWSQIDESRELILQPSEAERQRWLSPLVLDEFGTTLDRMSDRHSAITTRLEASLARLPNSGEVLGRGLRGMTPGWPALAALFPALLGLTLAGFSVWRSQTFFALSKALTLTPDVKTLLWLRADLAGGRSTQPRSLTWAYLRTLLTALGAALWMGIAAWHQDRSGGFAENELLGLLAFGGGCVFLATVLRLFSLQALWSVVPIAPPLVTETSLDGSTDGDNITTPDSEDGQADFLDQHTLQH